MHELASKNRSLDFSPKNPFRVVSWRWDRAGNIVEGGPPISRRKDDAWISRAWRFRSEWEACKNSQDYYILAARDPAIYWAYEVYRNRLDDRKKILASSIEARLIATQPMEGIAARTPLQLESVVAYEKLFFNVEGRHDQLDYVAAMVMGPTAYNAGIRPRNYDLLWKMYGWGYGHLFLDAFLTHRTGTARPVDAEGVEPAMEDATKSNYKQKAMVASETLDPNNFNAMIVLEGWARLCENQKGAGKGAGSQQTILTNVSAMMTALPFRVGANPPPHGVEGRSSVGAHMLAPFDQGAAELRGDELMNMAVGYAPPQNLDRLVYPPPMHGLPAPVEADTV